MKKGSTLQWVVVVASAIIIEVAAFVLFPSPSPTYSEVNRAGAPLTDGAAIRYDTSKPAAYPNGRTLADDAYDAQLQSDDGVDKNDATFGVVLPYLATPR